MAGFSAYIKRKWWHKGVEEPHRLVFDRVKELEGHLASIRTRNQINLSRYLNKQFVGIGDLDHSALVSEIPDAISLNAVRAAADSIAANICMSTPRPYFLTDNGSFDAQEKARGLQKWSQGILSQNNVAVDVAPRAFIDAEIMMFGCVKVFARDGRIKIQRVHPNKIVFDVVAAESAQPRELFQVEYYKKEVLAALFPKHEDKIALAETLIAPSGSSVTDMVKVIEAWHLPSSRDAKDGRHIIAIEGQELLNEEWSRDTFPFAFLPWAERPDNYFIGQPLVEQIGPIQDELDNIVNRIKESAHLGSFAWVIIDKNSGVNKRHLKNIPHIIIEKTGGSDPKVQVNPFVHPQIFEYINLLYSKAFELAGVSQLSAMSVVPERVRGTGAAMRTLSEQESKRFSSIAKKWENFWCDIVRLAVDAAHEEAEAGRDIEVNYQDKEWIERINFKDCSLEKDRYTIDVYPTNSLPQTPAGKLALVEQLSGLGAIQDPSMVLELLQLPDVEKHASLETANLRSAHQICEYLLAKASNWIEPEEFLDLKTTVQVARKYWIRAHINGVPDDRLDNLGRWIGEALSIIKQQEAALQPPPQPPAAPPTAPVMPTDPAAGAGGAEITELPIAA